MTGKFLGLAVARLASPASSFLVVLLIARYWGGELLGEYAVLWAWLALFQQLSTLGITEHITRELGYHKERIRGSLSHGFVLVALASSLWTAALIGCAMLTRAPGAFSEHLVIASLAVPPAACSAFCHAVCAALHRIRLVALACAIENALFVAAASAVVLNRLGLQALLWSLVLARAAGAALSIFLVVTRIDAPEKTLNWPTFRRMLTSVSVFAVTGAAFQVYSRADVVIMARLKDMATVGLYSSAAKLLELSTMLPLTFYLLNLSVAADAYRNRTPCANREMQQLFGRYFLGVWSVFTGGVVLARPVLTLLYGEAFAQSAAVLRVLMCVFVLQSAQLMLEMCCQAAGYQKTAMSIALARAAVSIGLHFALIPAFGAMGSALALLAATTMSCAAFWIVARTRLGMTVTAFALRNERCFHPNSKSRSSFPPTIARPSSGGAWTPLPGRPSPRIRLK